MGETAAAAVGVRWGEAGSGLAAEPQTPAAAADDAATSTIASQLFPASTSPRSCETLVAGLRRDN